MNTSRYNQLFSFIWDIANDSSLFTSYPGGIGAFYEKEVKPYDPEVQFGEPVIGYELSFTKYFYKPVQLRSLEEIMADINVLESETKGLWNEILG